MLACVVGGVMVNNSLRHRQKLTRSGVLSAKQSPWTHLYKNGDDQSFQVVTGLSRDVFRRLYRVIFTGEAPRPGRKSYLSRSAKLGLALVYLGSRMTISQLCISLNEILPLICKKFKSHPAAKIKFPNAEQGSFSRLRSRLTSDKEKTYNLALLCLIVQFSHSLCRTKSNC